MRLLYLGPEDTLDHVKSCLPEGTIIDLALDDESVDKVITECDTILDAYMKIRFPVERLEKAANLKLFVTATTGADHIGQEYLEEKNIPLLTLMGQRDVLRNITAAAEHSWLLLLACARTLRTAVDEVLEGGWDRNNHPGLMLNGKTLGLIGCGRIGTWMSRYGNAFGMKCLSYDPFADPWPENVENVPLKELLNNSDCIGVHVPLAEETKSLIGEEELNEVKPGVVIVNTSRGEIIDESALLDALKDGRVGSVGLDVLYGEPDIENHPLRLYSLDHPNVIITPHIGGFSPDALKFVLSFSCGRIRNFYEKGIAQ